MIRAVAAGALCLAVSAASVAADDPIGSDDVNGTNPGSRGTNSGTASIGTTGETCRVVWQIGADRYVGTVVGNDSGLAMDSSGGGWKGV